MDKSLNKMFIDELVKERNRLVHQIGSLQTELNIVQRMIDNRTKLEIDDSHIKIQTDAKKPLQAITGFLSERPDKSFSPAELRDELEYLKKQGLLISSAGNLLNVVHSTLKTLLKYRIIIKVEGENNPVYRYRQKRL